jgi:hypothetical protein
MTDAVQVGVARMRDWGEAHDWRGYDPYDALNSPFAPYLTLGTRLGRRLLTQTVKLSPLNLSPEIRVTPAWNAKAIALVASGYARLWAAHGDRGARDHARRWLRWLIDNSTTPTGLGWGYHFDVQTRFFAYPRETPNVIATSFAAHALLDGYELLGDERFGEGALGSCAFLTDRLLEHGAGRTFFRYLSEERELVHNANVLACSVLARTATLLGRHELEEPVLRALSSTLDAQAPDGSWPYAEGDGHGWVDNFHTGYVLEGLAYCEPVAPGVRPRLERGLDYWERELFLSDGTPKYYAGRVLPIDAHNYAQAIETWLSVASWRPTAMGLAERCAGKLVGDMLAPDGHVVFQRRRHWSNQVPFVRWTTAPAFRALARVELVRARNAREVAA